MTTRKKSKRIEPEGNLPGCVAGPQAKALARAVFSGWGNNGDQCQRLAAKGGRYPDAETDLGGLCEEALAEVIEKELRSAK